MKVVSLASAGALLALAAPASALPLPGTGLDASGELTLLSDYRFRGVSRSGGDPAIQGMLTLSTNSGFYTGVRGTTLNGFDPVRLRDPQLEDLGDLELDLYAGYGREIGAGVSVDGGLMYYVFTGSDGSANYFEPYASVSYLLGPVEATAGAKYAPQQDAIGGEDMLYLFAEAEAGIPLTPVTLMAHAGRQDWGDFGSYWNWSVGARTVIGPVQASVRYVDTDFPDIENFPTFDELNGGLVFSAGVRF